MYTKNLTHDFRLRLSDVDMEFLQKLSADRGQSVSEVTRSIIGEYRRSLESLDVLSRALTLVKEGQLSNGDTKTNIDN